MAGNKIEQVIFDEMGVPGNAVFPENTERQWETFTEINDQKYIASVDVSTGGDLSAVCLAIANAAKEFVVLFDRAFSEAVKEISNFVDAPFFAYTPRRVAHLAKYGRSERVRKKNRKRILKWIEMGNKT